MKYWIFVEIYIIVFFVILGGCEPKVKSCKIEDNRKPDDILIMLIGKTDTPVEITRIYGNGHYDYQDYIAKTGVWEKSSGVVPSTIMEKIVQEGVKSKQIKYENGINIYNYNLSDSFHEHPSGFGDLLGYINTCQK